MADWYPLPGTLKGERGDDGEAGAQGEPGEVGPDGQRGSLWFSHAEGTTPTTVGRQVGDRSMSPTGKVLRLVQGG